MTANALPEHWISRFCVPVSLHRDHDRNFESIFFQSLMQSLQIDKTLTTFFHPQSNAVMLAETIDDFRINWTQQPP